MITLDARQGVDQFGIAHHEANPPARHVVTFTHGKKLNRDLTGTRHLHNRWCLIAIETDVCVSKIVHNDDVVLLGELNYAFKKREIYALRGGITRKAQDHHFRLGNGFAHRALEFFEEISSRGHANGADVGPCDHGAINMNRIARVGHQNGIARIQGRKHQVGEAFFGANCHDGFRVRIKLYLIAARIPIRDRLAQTRDPF